MVKVFLSLNFGKLLSSTFCLFKIGQSNDLWYNIRRCKGVYALVIAYKFKTSHDLHWTATLGSFCWRLVLCLLTINNCNITTTTTTTTTIPLFLKPRTFTPTHPQPPTPSSYTLLLFSLLFSFRHVDLSSVIVSFELFLTQRP